MFKNRYGFPVCDVRSRNDVSRIVCEDQTPKRLWFKKVWKVFYTNRVAVMLATISITRKPHDMAFEGKFLGNPDFFPKIDKDIKWNIFLKYISFMVKKNLSFLRNILAQMNRVYSSEISNQQANNVLASPPSIVCLFLFANNFPQKKRWTWNQKKKLFSSLRFQHSRFLECALSKSFTD